MTDAIFGAGFAGLSPQQRLEKTAKELEAVVVSQVFSAMRKTVPDSGLFEKSEADDIFRTMLDDQLARVVADKGPFGLAKAVTKELGAELAKSGAAAPAEAGAPTPSTALAPAQHPALMHAPALSTAQRPTPALPPARRPAPPPASPAKSSRWRG